MWYLLQLDLRNEPLMTTDYEELSISSLPLAIDATFISSVKSFYVDCDNPELN